MQRNIFDIIPTEILLNEISARITEKKDMQTILRLSKIGLSFFDSEKAWKIRIQNEFGIDWNIETLPLSITSTPGFFKQCHIRMNRLHSHATNAQKQKDLIENRSLAIACCTDSFEHLCTILQKEKIGKSIIAAIAAQSHEITDKLITPEMQLSSLSSYLDFAIGTANIKLVKRLLNMKYKNKKYFHELIENDDAIKYLHFAIKNDSYETAFTLLNFRDETEKYWITPTNETLALTMETKQEKLALLLFDRKNQNNEWLFIADTPLLSLAIEFGLKKLAKKIYTRRKKTGSIHPSNTKKLFLKSVECRQASFALTFLNEKTPDGFPAIDLNNNLYQYTLQFAYYAILKEILARKPSITPTMQDVFFVINTTQKMTGHERSKTIMLLLKHGNLAPTQQILLAAIKSGKFLLVKKLLQIKNEDNQAIFTPTLELLTNTLKNKKRSKTAMELYQPLKNQLSHPEMLTLLEIAIHRHVEIAIDLLTATNLNKKPIINFYFNQVLSSALPNKDKLTLYLIKIKNDRGKFLVPFSTNDFALAVKEKCHKTALYIFHSLKRLNASLILPNLFNLLMAGNYEQPLLQLLEFKNENINLAFSIQGFCKAIAHYGNHINIMIINTFMCELRKASQHELLTLFNQTLNCGNQELALHLLKLTGKHRDPLIIPTINILNNAIETEMIDVVSYLLALKDYFNIPLLPINEKILEDTKTNDDDELYNILLCYKNFRAALQEINAQNNQVANNQFLESLSQSVKHFCIQMEALLVDGNKSILNWLQTSFQINLSNAGTYPIEKKLLQELQIKMGDELSNNKIKP